MSALPKHRYTLEEYFALELSTNERFEYFDGEVFSMSGVNEQHAQIEVNLAISLGGLLRRRECRFFPANMRIKVPASPPYRYADSSALCGTPVFEKIGGVDVLTNPQLIIEILSESTEKYDREIKFKNYKSIESFREYLLISQESAFIHHFIKQNEKFWMQTEYDNLADEINFATLDCTITLGEIYEGLELSDPQEILRNADRQL